MKRNPTIEKYRSSAVLTAAGLMLWELIARFHQSVLHAIWRMLGLGGPVPDWSFLSSPIEVIKSAPREILNGDLPVAITLTAVHCLIAFLIAWALGITIGSLVAESTKFRKAVVPILNGISGVPPVMLLPVLLIAFRLGAGGVVALAVFGSLVSIILICNESLKELKADFGLMVSNSGYSSFGVRLWKLSTASNKLMTAAREGLRWCLILAVVGEMHGSVAGGLGAYGDSARLNQSYDLVFLAILACAVVSLFLNALLNWAASLMHFLVKRSLLGHGSDFDSVLG